MLRVTLAAALLAAALSCAPAGSTDSESEIAQAPEGAAAPAPSPGAPLLHIATAEQILEGVRATESEAVLLNIWATWCIPCREEFPDLMRLREAYADRGLELVLVSADFDDQVEEVTAFLAENGVDFPSYLKQQKDMPFIDAMNPEWTGALPASFVYDRNGQMTYFREGKATYQMLEEQVLEVLTENQKQPN